MRLIQLLICLILYSTKIFGQVPVDGLIANYKFNANFKDSAGTGLVGSASNAYFTVDRFGLTNKAIAFNGNAYVSIPASTAIQPTNKLTISVWAKTNALTTLSNPILYKYISSGNKMASYAIDASYNYGSPVVTSHKYNGRLTIAQSIELKAITSKTPTIGSWTMLTLTYDGSYARMYVNGVLDTSYSYSGNILYGTTPLYIGYNPETSPATYYTGVIDDFLVYNRALSACEINRMYRNDSISNTIKPQINVLTSTTQCLSNNNFIFNASISPINNTKYYWYLDSLAYNTNGNVNSINKTFANQGTHQVKLIQVDSAFVCYDTAIKYVNVTQGMSPKISYLNSSPCLSKNSFYFIDSTNNSNPIKFRKWDFGDLTKDTSGSIRLTKVYLDSGQYKVKLNLTDTLGCKDSAIITIKVSKDPKPKIAIKDTTLCLNNSVQFYDSSQVKVLGSTSVWTFGDATYSIAANPLHKYTQSGVYNVMLKVDNNGCIDSINKTISIKPPINVVSKLQILNSCDKYSSVKLFDSTILNNAVLLSRKWIYNDNVIDTGSLLDIYNWNSGNYTVWLKLMNSDFCVDSVANSFNINPTPKSTIYLADPSTQCSKNSLFRLVDSTSFSGGFYTPIWAFPNATNVISKTLTKSLLAPGSYKIKLITLSSNLCADTSEKEINIFPSPTPNFGIIYSSHCQFDSPIQLIDSTVLSGGSYNLQWKFDSVITNQSSPYFNINDVGTHAIQLRVQTNKNCIDSISKSFIVYEKPKAVFNSTNDVSCFKNNTFQLQNQSTIQSGLLNYSWIVDSLLVGQTKDLTYSFKGAGTHAVKLISASNNNCYDTFVKQFTILPSPKIKYSINKSIQCLDKNLFVLTDSSSISNNASYTRLWIIGKDSFTNATFSQSYKDTVNINSSLILTSNLGCIDSSNFQLSVKSMPKINLTLDNIKLCLGLPIKLNDLSVSYDPIESRQLFFGDGIYSNKFLESYTYLNADTYQLKYLIKTKYACADSITIPIEILSKPNALTKKEVVSSCFSTNEIKLMNLSNYNGLKSSLKWIFPKYTVNDSNIIVYHSTIEGKNPYQLIAINEALCSDTLHDTIIVSADVRTSLISGPALSSVYSIEAYQVDYNLGSSYFWDVNLGDFEKDESKLIVTWTQPGLAQIKVVETNANGCSGDTVYKAVRINFASGIEEITDEHFHIYPNPFHSDFNISGLPKLSIIMLYDLNGKKILERHSNLESENFESAEIKNGLYLLKVQAEDKILYSKLLLKQ